MAALTKSAQTEIATAAVKALKALAANATAAVGDAGGADGAVEDASPAAARSSPAIASPSRAAASPLPMRCRNTPADTPSIRINRTRTCRRWKAISPVLRRASRVTTASSLTARNRTVMASPVVAGADAAAVAAIVATATSRVHRSAAKAMASRAIRVSRRR